MAQRGLLKLVTLDVTNTLIKVCGSPGRQYALIGHKHGVMADMNLLNELFYKYYKDHSKRFPNFGAQNMMPAYIWWSLLVKDCFRSADPTIGEETLSKIANDLYFHYTTPNAWEILPGAVSAIQDLRQYPVRIGVVSNWDHRLYKVLLTMKLRSYFDFVLPSYIIGAEKPDSAIFQQALKDANCLPEEAIHFGDSIEKDFLGARRVGMGAYLLAHTNIFEEFIDKKFVVKSVPEFVEAIRPRLEEANIHNRASSVKHL
ncbi:haloacid dehalogenase-like hydrolase domain-containing protein 3 [Biomphalaria pfeifferi]|uniref:Haloacid dehalogenase-like hydrolase domain-containing protein 3 n=1 Tax=Biomphalaria pfeifferi TaxID=112525 RepID=A0AAD8EXC0_BIOPF|nr:haloacid dehalogenase-like hydrolase domain-containing protein 3 [Biomphalaria pfeifferi]